MRSFLKIRPWGLLLGTAVLSFLMPFGGAVASSLEEAQNFYQRRNYAEARVAFEAVLPTLQGLERARALNKYAFAMERSIRNREQVILLHKEVLEIPEAEIKDRAYATTRIGYNHQLLRRHDEAIVYYQKVVDMEGAPPTMVSEALLRTAWALNGTDREDKEEQMIAALEKLIALPGADPGNLGNAYRTIGNLYRRKGEYDKAIEVYTQVQELEDIPAHVQRANQHMITEIVGEREAASEFYVRPWVPDVGEDYATLFWISREGIAPGEVLVRGESTTEVAFRGNSLQQELPRNSEGILQRIQIDGLEPGKRYHYTVTVDESTAEGSFQTAPVAGSTEPVRIGIYADTQNQGYRHEPVARQLAADEPEVTIHLGDLVDTGSRWLDWKHQFFDPGHVIFSQTAIFPTRGNHDGGPYFRPYFARDEFDYRTLSWGPVDLFILASYGPDSSGSGREKQVDWLRTVLSESEARWKVVVLHHPLIHTGVRRGWGQEDFLPLLDSLDVDLILNGHAHSYRRYLPIGTKSKHPFLHITMGSAGGGLSRAHPGPLLVMGELRFHHLVIDANFESLNVFARDMEGEIFDQFSIRKDADGKWEESWASQAISVERAKEFVPFYEELGTHGFDAKIISVSSEGFAEIEWTPFWTDIEGEYQLVLRLADGETRWTMEEQVVPLQQPIRFRAKPVLELPGRLNIEVQPTVDGVALVPQSFRLTLVSRQE